GDNGKSISVSGFWASVKAVARRSTGRAWQWDWAFPGFDLEWGLGMMEGKYENQGGGSTRFVAGWCGADFQGVFVGFDDVVDGEGDCEGFGDQSGCAFWVGEVSPGVVAVFGAGSGLQIAACLCG